MVDRAIEDRKIAEKLSKVAGLRGYSSLTSGAKQALVDVLRKYAESVEHCESIVEQWIETHTEVPTPFDLKEMTSQVMAPQAAAIAKASGMGRCGCCSGTGFDSYDELVYEIDVPNVRRPMRRELRLLASAAWTLRALDPQTNRPKWQAALAVGDVPDEMLHSTAIAVRDQVRQEIERAPHSLRGYEIIAKSGQCACRRLAS